MARKLAALVTCGMMAMSATAITTPAKAQLGVVGAIAAGVADSVAYGGRNYCFYPDGWRGPGWYWCGYAYRRGFGWGGPEGWHGFRRGGGGFRGGFHGGGGFRGGPRGGGGFHGGGGHGGGGHGGGGHGGGGHGGGGHH